jgi:stage II sporulation protein AA (anti-sigma F factor antagonist)
MPVTLSYEKCRLTARLSGEIDHHSAAFLREQVDQALAKLRPPTLSIDFAEVSFMDSSAVGLVMGRFKAVQAFGGELEVINLSPTAYRMMRMSKLQTLAKLRQAQPQEKEESRV